MDLMGLNVVSLRSALKHPEREANIAAFRGSARTDMMVANHKVGAFGLNIHDNCRCTLTYPTPWPR